jgi:hypothetical protein
MTSNSDSSLSRAEAIYLHRYFFHADPPPGVVERYIAANQLCLPSLDQLSHHLVSTVVSRRLDPEAVEAILRLRRKNPVLTRKIQILFYLVEVRTHYYSYFVNTPTGPFRAFLELLTSAALTVWKLIKGLYLIQRHGLV